MCNFRVFLSIFLRTGLWLLIGVSSTAALAVPSSRIFLLRSFHIIYSLEDNK